MSIKVKILGWQTSLVALGCLATALAAHHLMVQSLARSQCDKLMVMAQDRAAHIGAMIVAKSAMIERAAVGQGIGDYTKTYNDPALAQYLGRFSGEFAELVYVNEQGREELKLVDGKRTDDLSDVSNTALFQDALWERNRVHVALRKPHRGLPEPSLAFAFCRQSYFDEFEGVITAYMPLSELLKDVYATGIDETGFFVVVDDEGTILSHPREDRLLQQLKVEGKNAGQLLASITSLEIGTGPASIEGKDAIVAYCPVEGRRWSVVAGLPSNEFMAAPNQLRNTAVAVFIAVIAVCLSVAVLLTSTITIGLSKLAAVAGALAGGDLSKRVTVKSRDEIGKLGEAFNNMADRLSGTIQVLNNEIGDRKQAQAELSESNEHLRRAQSELVQSEKMGMLGQLAAGVAHEINTPTGAILNVSTDVPRHLQELVRLGMETSSLPLETSQWLTDVLKNVPEMHLLGGNPVTRDKRRQLERELKAAGVPEERRVADVIICYGFPQTGDDQGVLRHLSHPQVLALLEHVAALKIASEVSTGSAEKIARIVRALRFYARDVHGAMVAVNVNESIEDTLVLLASRLKRVARVKTNFMPSIPPVAAGTELAQVWANIIGNACDAIETSRPGQVGAIEIATRHEGPQTRAAGAEHHAEGSVVVTISNEGPPIPEEDIRRLFDPFFTTKPIGKGTGLGLSICAGIVQRYGGTIVARNESGKVVFEVTLPAEAGPSSQDSPAKKAPAAQAAGAMEAPDPAAVGGR